MFCYNYQFFYVLGLSCSSLGDCFGFDPQLLVSHRFYHKKKEIWYWNAVVSYTKWTQPPFFMLPQKMHMRHFKVLYWSISQHWVCSLLTASESEFLMWHGSLTHCCFFEGQYFEVPILLCAISLKEPYSYYYWHKKRWNSLNSDSFLYSFLRMNLWTNQIF